MLSLGAPLLFKLHLPNNYYSWRWFLRLVQQAVRTRIEYYRKAEPSPREDYEVGNIVLQDPFFLPRDRWIPAPADFAKSVVQGKSYDLAQPVGRDLWNRVMLARAMTPRAVSEGRVEVEGPIFGEAQPGTVRLKQGAFRVMVTDAYNRRCAISGEKALLVLQAAHIVPVADGGLHQMDNGILLRSDVHKLFDRGHITVTPEHRVLVASRALKDDFDNGEPYVPFHGTTIRLPDRESERPSRLQLEWHNQTIYGG